MFLDLLKILGLSLIAIWFYKVYYNLFVTPLKEIPSPIILQIFPFIYTFIQVAGLDHLLVYYLHLYYGEVVRVSWGVVSFNNLEACKEIYSTYKFPKDTLYSGFHRAGETTFSTLNKEHHRNRRKILAPSFSESKLQQLEPKVKQTGVLPLIQRIENALENQSKIDLGLWFHYTTFDVTGMLLFNKSFDILKGSDHPIIHWIDTYFFHSILRGVLPAINIYTDSGIKNLFQFTYKQIETYNPSSDRKSIMDFFIEAKDSESGNKLNEREVAEEIVLQLGAGIDTTANSLSWIFYLLLKDKPVYNKLKNELKNKFNSVEEINYNQCKNECPYLNAVICEGMRLYPVAAIMLPRSSPIGGATVSGYYIPEGTTVGTSYYCLQRYEKYFPNPNDYIPERWINSENKFINHEAYYPFSLGPRGCVGRTLAWYQLYNITASLVYSFELSLKDPNLQLYGINNLILKAKGEFLVDGNKS
ncbi:cytochrome P450 [Neoconidiobolus thromboides FSU 785]|nr:cytochrome P450 [Neoconidiobolus thromboides FSU 785]